MSITSLPPPPERRVPLVVPMVPRLAEEGGARGDDSRGSGSGGVAGISPSILIIAVIVVVMLLASISIHYFIRSLCRRSTSSSAPPLPLVAVRSSAVAPATAAPSVAGQGKEAAAERERLIERLPLFTLASSLAALPRSSRDCAVCQSVFGGDEELRLLPACRHAFHSRCVDPWLRANPSCPLCRASIALPHPPLPELLRVELGSVSSRRSTSSDSAAVAAAAPRAYPLPSLPNSTAEYLVEEDLQVVLKPANPPLAPTSQITGEPSQQLATAGERALQPQPSSSVTPTASFRSVGRSSSRWSNRWSSRWSSGRWSSRYDAGSVTAAATAEWWWDMDGGVAPAVSRRGEAEDGSAFYGFVRWLTGAY
ncbi:hypothetical protein QYE76_012769 [Lolium multiflorum]|uniref:RING-type domain-containing protein n=1 Tax=Lolium multiflorum TaxID=4521 RepID=A0AAD8U1M0_LOLMU|nr:hypothetical protein QYE76_012769 [Lolium multiflorum]